MHLADQRHDRSCPLRQHLTQMRASPPACQKTPRHRPPSAARFHRIGRGRRSPRAASPYPVRAAKRAGAPGTTASTALPAASACIACASSVSASGPRQSTRPRGSSVNVFASPVGPGRSTGPKSSPPRLRSPRPPLPRRCLRRTGDAVGARRPAASAGSGRLLGQFAVPSPCAPRQRSGRHPADLRKRLR